MSDHIRRLPRVMQLAQVAREVLVMDVHDAYKAARHGKLKGAFKIGKHWYVSLPAMIAGMQVPNDDVPRRRAAANGRAHGDATQERWDATWALEQEP